MCAVRAMNEFANHYLTEQQFPFSYCVVMEFIVYPFKFSIFFNSRKFVSTEHKKRHERRKIVQSAINIVHAVCCFICSKLPEYRGKVFRCRKGFFLYSVGCHKSDYTYFSFVCIHHIRLQPSSSYWEFPYQTGGFFFIRTFHMSPRWKVRHLNYSFAMKQIANGTRKFWCCNALQTS